VEAYRFARVWGSHIFLDSRFTDGCEVVSLTRQPLFTPRKIPGTHFCWRLCWPQGCIMEGLGKLKKKSNDLIWNRTLDLLACSIVPQPTALSRTPVIFQDSYKIRQLQIFYFLSRVKNMDISPYCDSLKHLRAFLHNSAVCWYDLFAVAQPRICIKVKLNFFFSFCLRDVCSWKSDPMEGVRWHCALLHRTMAGGGARQMDLRWLEGLEIAATNHEKIMRLRMRVAVTSHLFQSRMHYKFV
jgi:hypothetical protein